MRLPVELSDKIIDELPIKSLKRASRVCRAWRDRSQRRLLHSIQLPKVWTPFPNTQHPAWVKHLLLLSTNPRIASFVRRFTFPDTTRRTDALGEFLPHFAAMLPNVNELILHSSPGRPAPTPFLMTALRAWASITSLAVHGIEFQSHIFAREFLLTFENLQSLRWAGILPQEPVNLLAGHELAHFPRLETLDMTGHGWDNTRHLLIFGTLTGLKKLHYLLPDFSWPGTGGVHMIECSLGNLVFLELQLSYCE